MQNPKPAAALTLLTMAAAVGLRLARVPNVSAVGALGLFAGGRLPLWLAWAPPLAVMAVADLILSAWLAYPPFNPWVYAGFVGYVLLGRLLARTNSPPRVGAAAVLGAVQFYLLTNLGVWFNQDGLATPMYPPTVAGLVACYVAGLPFLGYTLLGDLGFSAALFGAHAWLARTEPAAAPEPEEVRA